MSVLAGPSHDLKLGNWTTRCYESEVELWTDHESLPATFINRLY